MNTFIRKLTVMVATVVAATLAQAHCGSCNMDADSGHGAHHHESTLSNDQFNQLLPHYIAIQKALAGDNLDAAKKSASEMVSKSVKSGDELAEPLNAIAVASDIGFARKAFLPISNLLIDAAKGMELPDNSGIYLAHCPMAFGNTGGSWLQDEAVLANPYFGAMMLRCGTIKPLAHK